MGQPRDAKTHHVAIATYQTYLQGLSSALPKAVMRVQPFANDEPTEGAISWQAHRPREGVARRLSAGWQKLHWH